MERLFTGVLIAFMILVVGVMVWADQVATLID